ncbi:MAG: CHAT domain-containing protein, partial [Bacteroidota bacterium]
NTKFNGLRKNNDYGTTNKLTGDLLVSEEKYTEAVLKYQQAIIQFDPPFNNIDPEKNPEEYSGVFSYINLFSALIAKGDAYRKLYTADKNTSKLIAALNAYRSAYRLIAYVEKTYDSDEARLFLNKTKYTIRTYPIEISLTLYDLTKDKKYLEEAYLFDQRNKASVLTLNVQENMLRRTFESTNDIFTRQAACKSIITRLSLKAAQATDSAQAKNINETIRDNEIKLSKIQDTINTTPSLSKYMPVEKIPSIIDLQNKTLDNKTALLSYHLSQRELITFVVMTGSFTYYKQTIDSSFFKKLQDFIHSVHDVNGENKFNGVENAQRLYFNLFSAIKNKLSGINRLVIIPDDELNYLPFEALQDENGNYLVNSFAIQYQYSTALIGEVNERKNDNNEILGIAPFATSGFSDTTRKIKFDPLFNSGTEINNLNGKTHLDKQATKSAFLQNANHYTIIHLATHASVNDDFPERSFIAFYPDSKDNLLFAQEIYDLNLDSTKLVILSACETGSGRLIRGEGMMSLSRAFAYAGCPNIITSLWKAEDKTTAFLSQQLHYYLKKGYTRDKALQQAKIDLLNSDRIEQRFKTPNYWAHLILIDNYEADKKVYPTLWIALTIVAAITISLFFFYKKKSLAS